jgi:HD-GYP domain-containing protein (c-di-GMP phosphodiesterase class II)
MMTICDIYDALRAGDRPYKPSMPVEKALDIIAAQVKAGQLDGAFFEVFIQAGIYNMPRTSGRSSGGAAA